MMETARPGGSDVHPRPFANGVKAFEDLDILCVVVGLSHLTSLFADGPGGGSGNGPGAAVSIADSGLGSEPQTLNKLLQRGHLFSPSKKTVEMRCQWSPEEARKAASMAARR